jgi:hypothetical protein
MAHDKRSEHEAIRDVVRRLSATFAGTHSVAQVEAAVMGSYEGFAGRPVRDFIPVLVERAAKSRLMTSARGDGARA